MNHYELLDNLNQGFCGILGSNLAGVYVHGSIAFGCYNPKKSDIDLIVVVYQKPDCTTKLKLLEVISALLPHCPHKGIEMSVVLKERCRNFVHPCPYELHFSNAWLDAYKQDPISLCGDEVKSDPDLAAHFTIIKHTGKVLYGEPVNDVFGDIKKEYYIDSIVNDVINAERDILKNPEYIILNLCRVLAFIEDGAIVSKQQGAEWAFENIDKQYQSLIQDALACYCSDNDMHINEGMDLEFAAYMLDRILKYQ